MSMLRRSPIKESCDGMTCGALDDSRSVEADSPLYKQSGRTTLNVKFELHKTKTPTEYA